MNDRTLKWKKQFGFKDLKSEEIENISNLLEMGLIFLLSYDKFKNNNILDDTTFCSILYRIGKMVGNITINDFFEIVDDFKLETNDMVNLSNYLSPIPHDCDFETYFVAYFSEKHIIRLQKT